MEFPFSIIRSRRLRRMTILIRPGGEVILKIPIHADEVAAQRFLHSKMDWIKAHVNKMQKILPRQKLPGGPRHYKEHKEAARKDLTDRVLHWNQLLNFKYGRIAIKQQKSRWGSCSTKNNLNFNYKLYFLPEHLRDYVVVHELCHVKEHNHSARFWNLVASIMPDFRKYEKELRGFHV